VKCEQELIARAREGDRDAFDALVTRASVLLEPFIASQLGETLARKVTAEDIRQEMLLGAWRCRGDFAGSDWESFLAWLRSIAQHAILDAAKSYRTQKRDPHREVPLATTSNSLANQPRVPQASGCTPSRHAARGERFERLRAALSKLSSEHRRVIVLARIEALPIKEVARRMGRSPDATSMLLLRALRKLREVFGDTKSLGLPKDQRLVDESSGDCDGE
jgi:RNA polymerase sigma-70 factor (ECF subfamily)